MQTKTMRMAPVTQYYLLEYTWIWTEPRSLLHTTQGSLLWLEFLSFFLFSLCVELDCKTHPFTSNTSDVDGQKWCSIISTNVLIWSRVLRYHTNINVTKNIQQKTNVIPKRKKIWAWQSHYKLSITDTKVPEKIVIKPISLQIQSYNWLQIYQ